MIGYCCNCLDGQLNWQAFTHCIIGRVTKLSIVQLVICGMAHTAQLGIEHIYVSPFRPCLKRKIEASQKLFKKIY